ncbi:uncharacterized protein L969DRAFT_548154 [Mixia osmundae IAM 14324]|uniref:Uncharacterized protein n=1 Tax=Mixia osmundae (strain CBS 9802 / IAM 14324 / JCM 22182 / KY 12970) TaxID=764103 RepID=G7E818_MIXOS|nr:uncharacterized protein L969DRAFT_548154 [Mixia osmundae IAM 14324]KEI38579.1 hypothetical protein L969DRAFT_548154 [Mixia osmundae IAM 14324]GAA98978.1 hypothetical protein E5Q_05667 [Mixia osmundae IAM 14324]
MQSEEPQDGDRFEPQFIQGDDGQTYEVLDEYELDRDAMDADEDDEADELPEDGQQTDEPPQELPEDTAVLHFGGHGAEASVFALARHPTLELAVSGGSDDIGFVFRTDNSELVTVLDKHDDSIIAASWSTDGELLATAGMDGIVRVYKATSAAAAESPPTWSPYKRLEGPDEIMWIAWNPEPKLSKFLAAGSNDGSVWCWPISNKDVSPFVLSSHIAPVTCGSWAPDGRRLLTGDGESALCLWNPSVPTPVLKLTGVDVRFLLEGGISALCLNSAGTLALVGGVDGGLKIVNLTSGTLIATLQEAESAKAPPASTAPADAAMETEELKGYSIECVGYLDGYGSGGAGGLWYSAGSDGYLRVWEASTGALRWRGDHKPAISTVAHHAGTPYLTTGSTSASLKTWDVRTGQLVNESTGHTDVIHVCVALPHGRILSGGDDGIVRIHQLSQ